jgi:hypothetical protein
MIRKKHNWPEKETDLAEVVIEWLRKDGWEVYEEVSPFVKKTNGKGYRSLDSGRADIVAVKRGIYKHTDLVWIIECKRSMTLELIEQGERWKHHAHFVSICVPEKQRSSNQQFGERICRSYGLGVLVANGPVGTSYAHVRQAVSPALNRHSNAKDFASCLNDQMNKFGKAGASGQYWTPFKQTSYEIQRIVSENPGIAFKEMMKLLKHHYASDASARASIPEYIVKGIIPGVHICRDGRKMLLYPKPVEVKSKEKDVVTILKGGGSLIQLIDALAVNDM